MARFIVLLRAINVGGTGVLPMAELRTLCERAGFTDVVTYIQSGNVVLSSEKGAAYVRETLSKVLEKRLGQPVGVLVRTREDLVALEASNPFPDAAPAQLLVVFLDADPDPAVLAKVVRAGGEQLVAGKNAIYVHFPQGQGKSKLKLPYADRGTARNMNTVRRLVALSDT